MPKTNRIKFTATRVEALTCPPGKKEVYLWDSDAPGLGLRTRQGGNKRYIFQGRVNGRTLKITLGDLEAWDFDTVRAEARRLRILCDQGIDPREERKQKDQAAEARRIQQERELATVGEAWSKYIEERQPDWSEVHYRDHIKAMQPPGLARKRSRQVTKAGVLHALHSAKLADLTPLVVERWLRTEKLTRPTVAARGFRLLRAFLTWCDENPAYSGLADHRALLTKKVRRAIPKSQAKSDALQREQLPAWFEAVRSIPNPVFSAYLQTLLLTGARRNELAPLTWADVDFQWQAVTIGDKVDGQRIIPLTPYLASILSALPRRSKWVFSATSSSGHLEDPHRPHVQALQIAGLPHLSIHGLRRSFGSLSEWVEAPVGVVAQIMGHKPSAIAEKHYRQRPLDLLRKWHVRIEKWILGQAGIDQPEQTNSEKLRVIR